MNKKELGYKRNQYKYCLTKLIEARKREIKAQQDVQRYSEQIVKLENELSEFVDIDLTLAELLSV